jgi:hypothetical protein
MMTADDPQFRDRLLAVQKQDDTLKQKYQQEIQAMLQQKLNTPMKWLLVIVMAFGLLAAGLTAANLPRWRLQEPDFQALALFSLVFELTCIACLGWIIARGSIRTGGPEFILALLAGIFSLVVAGFFEDVTRYVPKDQTPHDIVLIIVFVVVLGWLPLVAVTISFYHNRTREKLLEIQYQLAQLAEEIPLAPRSITQRICGK